MITAFDGDALARAVAIAPDGKIVVAGYTEAEGHRSFALARYNVDGSLDASFGASGKIVMPAGSGDSEAAGVAVQPDGGIVAVGYLSPGPYQGLHCLIARFTSEGVLDTRFGADGVVLGTPGVPDGCAAIALQSDGKIVASGAYTVDFTTLRFNTDGSVDTAFGKDGAATHPPAPPESYWNASSPCSSVAVQPDGKIAVVMTPALIIGPSGGYGLALARFGPDGSIDSTFGRDGLFYQPPPGGFALSCRVELLPEGNIVAAVDRVFRWLPTGALDPSFDPPVGGVVSLAAQQNGKIVAVANPGFQVFRLTPSGALDSGFGDGGKLDTVIGTDRSANAVTLQPDGRIVVAGTASTTVVDATGALVTRQNFALARYIGDPTP